MNYFVIGAGGTGGCIGGYLAAGGKSVTMLARGAHLAAMQTDGLYLHATRKGELHLPQIKAVSEQDALEIADVVFVCVKGYSVDTVVPLLKRVADAHTVIIPVLNVAGTGEKLAHALDAGIVLEGCIYISGYISAPGHVTQTGAMFRIIFGERAGDAHAQTLEAIAQDLRDCGIDAVVSSTIQSDVFRKFAYISPFAATGAYFDIAASGMQQAGEPRTLFTALVRELCAIAAAQGLTFPGDLETEIMQRIDGTLPETTTSMQKDLAKGGSSELDGLIFEVLRMGERLGVATPAYRMAAKKFGMNA